MEILKDITIILLTIVVIGKGAIWLVDAAIRVAKRLGISELVIGLTIVAIGTSAPEFGVTILAAFRGMSDISVGNIVGSNIFNLGFILGGTAVIHSLKTNRTIVQRDGFFLLFGSILLVGFLWNLSLNRTEGIILFVLLIVYLSYLYLKKETVGAEVTIGKFRWQDPMLLLLGMGMVLGGSHFLVISAVSLAKIMGVSEWVIGTTIVAAGTSAPEFATSLVAALRGRYGISVGNLIGSDIFNLFGVLGLAAILRNLPVDDDAIPNLILLTLMVILVLIFMRTGWVISRREGVVLVIIGLSRWIYTFW
ncbi:MAG: sodium:calcium antiporter [Candidatus Marinimicrobia bacterium]|nr:sodium:calcium antiporter [Candidatus Neomarinimicrobiota bacterium]